MAERFIVGRVLPIHPDTFGRAAIPAKATILHWDHAANTLWCWLPEYEADEEPESGWSSGSSPAS